MDAGLLDRWIGASIGPPVIADDADGAIDLDRWISASIAAPLMCPTGVVITAPMACVITGTSVVVAGLSVGTVAPYAPYRDQQGATWTQWIVVGQVC
jgi:hypothetical protein